MGRRATNARISRDSLVLQDLTNNVIGEEVQAVELFRTTLLRGRNA